MTDGNCHSHIRCGSSDGPVFGQEASEIWSNLMQWAEGPRAYKVGYQRMLRKYENDIPRTSYIHELYKDESKALYKQDFKFSNAVLVDVCESLFHAFKKWVFGNSGKSASLLMAVVRIVEGCRLMIFKPFLFDPQLSRRVSIKLTSNQTMKMLFRYLSDKITRWPVGFMYEKVDFARGSYSLEDDDNGDVEVTNRKTGDVFLVDGDYICHMGDKLCWQQMYTGLPCVHSLLVVLEHLTMSDDDKIRESICNQVVHLCNPNWYRQSYNDTIKDSKCWYSVPPPPIPVTEPTLHDPLLQYKERFRHVIQFLKPRMIEQFLQQMEKYSFLQRPSSTDVPVFTSKFLDQVPESYKDSSSDDVDNDSKVTKLHNTTTTTPRSPSKFQNQSRRKKKRKSSPRNARSKLKPRRKSRHRNGGYRTEDEIVSSMFSPSSTDGDEDVIVNF